MEVRPELLQARGELGSRRERSLDVSAWGATVPTNRGTTLLCDLHAII